ncbi:hypothetical protein TNCV_3541581 [Trichonephila clavipes]|nr:hypothetical protein TNCV_3541581 [Trichonephila clavipes]
MEQKWICIRDDHASHAHQEAKLNMKWSQQHRSKPLVSGTKVKHRYKVNQPSPVFENTTGLKGKENSVAWKWRICCLVSMLLGPQSLRFFLSSPEIARVCDTTGYRRSHIMGRRRFR